jgi:bifunctional DNA-binding transcriptional regulator/antitoxin component of YhaV-PrlF toxin-antitoxin module
MKNRKRTKKYKKSINNIQCLGPCYKPDTYVVHPVYLEHINKYDDNPFCPTEYHEVDDAKTGKKKVIPYDICANPTDISDISTSESIILFQSGFTKDVFLSLYYDINSFEEMVDWLNTNKMALIDTKTRIVNAALNIYDNSIEYFDDVFIKFYIDYMKDKFTKKIYKEIHENIGIKEGDILITKEKDNKLKYDEYTIERINYIVEKFLNIDEVRKFLHKIIKANEINFEDYDDSLIIIANKHVEYIKNTIL